MTAKSWCQNWHPLTLSRVRCSEIGFLTSLNASQVTCIRWHQRTNFTAQRSIWGPNAQEKGHWDDRDFIVHWLAQAGWTKKGKLLQITSSLIDSGSGCLAGLCCWFQQPDWQCWQHSRRPAYFNTCEETEWLKKKGPNLPWKSQNMLCCSHLVVNHFSSFFFLSLKKRKFVFSVRAHACVRQCLSRVHRNQTNKRLPHSPLAFRWESAFLFQWLPLSPEGMQSQKWHSVWFSLEHRQGLFWSLLSH